MRFALFFLIWLSLSKSAVSQCDSTLVGKWKVVSVKTSEVYFNLKTDSSFVEPDAIRNYPDTNRQIIIEMNKMAWSNIQFEFKKGNSFTLSMMEGLSENGKYCFDQIKKSLNVTMKNGLGEDKTEEWKVYLNNQYLHMTFTFGEEEEEEMFFVFERADI